jgi:hypothetical protein
MTVALPVPRARDLLLFFQEKYFLADNGAKSATVPVADKKAVRGQGQPITRERLIDLLNEDLAREYQAILAYTVYAQVLKGAQYMAIAGVTGEARQTGTRACPDRLEADRLSRRHANGAAQAGSHVEEARRHAAFRSRRGE